VKNIIVFGASSDIAISCEKLWAAENNSLFLVARNQQKLDELTDLLLQSGAKSIESYCCDFKSVNDMKIVVSMADKFLDGIDIAFIAHGSLPNQLKYQNNPELTLEDIKNNALSTVSILTILANYFEEKKSGKIALLSSVAGDIGKASNYIYGSSKAMLNLFMAGLRLRFSNTDVSVTTIKLGYVDTKMTSNFDKNFLWVKPHFIAKSIVKSIDKSKEEVYLPKIWFFIISFLKIVPIRILKLLKL